MILDADGLGESGMVQGDIAIVGGGAAGITIAQALAGSGLTVILIESGTKRRGEPGADGFRGESIGTAMDPAGGRFQGLGGSTNRWTGRCAPLDPIDLAPRDWVPHSGWPIGWDELARWYGPAEAVCGLSDAAPVPPATDGDTVAPFGWRFAATGWKTYQSWGDRYHDLLRLDPNIRVVTGALAAGIAIDGGDITHARWLTLRTHRLREVRVIARHFVLSAGGIENARLLLDVIASQPGTLPAVADSVGRYFMQHPRVTTATIACTRAQAARLQQSFNNFPSSRGHHHEIGFALTPETQARERLLNASAVLRYDAAPSAARRGWAALRSGMTPYPREWLALAGYALRPDRLLPRAATRMAGRLALRTDPIVSLVVDIEQAPQPDSRITLANSLDRYGRRRARVDWRIAEQDRSTVRHMTEGIATFLATRDLGRLVPEAVDDILDPARMQHSFHHIGSTRMSDSPRDGVVDRDGRVHGTANLYACGSSVMPTGGHANPTFTIVALALRLADHLKAVATA
ncbi:GMC family oxidoreductase [Sphingomonas naphthae]|uniref:GMC family oxidoreductase n=1 Tax=Sphingomonas naphthae TaxID=1813468 RepID=A0ABY7TQY3_9SPHN|nr:GMC family oxidoreductase [Sphingomonas naphthae]WCT75086.1 GMC family oxidoreductase [Sphingomonas naphthae]